MWLVATTPKRCCVRITGRETKAHARGSCSSISRSCARSRSGTRTAASRATTSVMRTPGENMSGAMKQVSRLGNPLVNEVVAPLGACVDDIAFIHNMVGKTGVHSQGTLLQTTGFDRPGFGISAGSGSPTADGA